MYVLTPMDNTRVLSYTMLSTFKSMYPLIASDLDGKLSYILVAYNRRLTVSGDYTTVNPTWCETLVAYN